MTLKAMGVTLLEIEFVNSSRGEVAKMLTAQQITSWEVPQDHSLGAAWIFRLNLARGSSLEFRSEMVELAGWEDIGILRIELLDKESRALRGPANMVRFAISPFQPTALESVFYEDCEVVAETGLVLSDFSGEIVLAAGIPPESVSVRIGGDDELFAPEVPLSRCSRRPWIESSGRS